MCALREIQKDREGGEVENASQWDVVMPQYLLHHFSILLRF